jgi:hypothetical protein
MMAAYFVISIIYWFFNKERLLILIKIVKDSFLKFDRDQKIALALFILSFLFYIVWREIKFDGIYYHYQNIRWNEEYPVTPGIGNLKDQLGFNSNYCLISAIFTFRFLFHEPLYLFQDVLFTFVIGWVCIEVVNSGFKPDRIILLILLFTFFLLNRDGLTDTSTDAVPNICIFYYICRFTLYPNALTKKLLLAILLPVALVTFKLSVLPLCLISVYLFFLLIKRRKYTLTFFYALIPFLILTLWLVRNVIVSGYLVYPVYQIDLFDVDWKIPRAIAEWQYGYISDWAKIVFKGFVSFRYFYNYGDISNIDDIISFIGIVFIYIFGLFILSSPFILFWGIRRKIEICKNIYILYCTTLCSIIYWFLSAPDFRFALGSIVGMVFIILHIMLLTGGKELVRVPAGSGIFFSFGILILFMCITRTFHFTYRVLTLPHAEEHLPLHYALLEPYSAKNYQIKEKNITTGFTEYKTKGILIYIPEDIISRSFDKLPCVSKTLYDKLQGVKVEEVVEARGPSIQDGFHVKEEYIKRIASSLKK